jgi:hypothetical protein
MASALDSFRAALLEEAAATRRARAISAAKDAMERAQYAAYTAGMAIDAVHYAIANVEDPDTVAELRASLDQYVVDARLAANSARYAEGRYLELVPPPPPPSPDPARVGPPPPDPMEWWTRTFVGEDGAARDAQGRPGPPLEPTLAGLWRERPVQRSAVLKALGPKDT